MDSIDMNEANKVRCITCGDDYVGPVEVKVKHAGKKNSILTVGSGGAALTGDGKGNERGVVIEIAFVCEQCGNNTLIVYEFYKGHTFVEEYEVAGVDNIYSDETIWRD